MLDSMSGFLDLPGNLLKHIGACSVGGYLPLSWGEEIDDTDSDIQIKDPLFIRKLRFIPLQSCPCAPAQMLIP